VSGTTSHREAWEDRECERIMNMTEEELAAEDGLPLEEARAKWKREKEEMLARLRASGVPV
jgi:hypothetical protein